IFVQKSPASTVGDLAQALKELAVRADLQTRLIGTRHGEKLYESLVSRVEMARTVNRESYYRIPADNRALNYSKYFSEGEAEISRLDDFTSHNAPRLNVADVKALLMRMELVRDAFDV